jgi:DNA-binding CsgD family transcriptional regulator
MFLLPPRLRDLLEKRPEEPAPRLLSGDRQLVRKVREIAVSQQRAEREIYDDIITSGMKILSDKDKYEGLWASLSIREQQVAALTCLGYRSYEIAGALSISYETVRTHSKHIYAKFGLTRSALRLALRNWDFEAWWEDHHP